MPNKLVNIKQLSVETGVPVRTLRTLKNRRLISHLKAGHRTVLFDPNRVRADLDKLTVQSV